MNFTERAGRRVHWAEVGEGPALVLLPGLGSGMRLFGTLPRRFARTGFRALTHDPLGVPPSDPLAGAFDFEAAADDVFAVVDAAGCDRVHLVGTSLGGRVALVAAARRPERVERLVLLASSAVPTPRSRRVQRFFEIVAESVPEQRFGDVVAPFLFGRSFHAAHPGVVDDIVRATRPSAATRALMVAQAQALQHFDARDAAQRIRAPALCLAGAEDTLTGTDEVRATADLLPAGRYREFAHAGHSLLLEDGTVFDAVVDFLRAQEPEA